MVAKIGVIGVGAIGQDHIRRMTDLVEDASVVAVNDVDIPRASEVASALPDCIVLKTGEELITSPDIDGVVVCSSGGTHAKYVLASIAASKPIFCEKPLATTQGDCQGIIAAEVATERHLVQVGFMRRYDRSHLALRRVLNGGVIGNALVFHCAHRISAVASTFTSEMMINDAVIHEIDMVRWLFNDEIIAVRTAIPRHNCRSPQTLTDPLLVYLTTASGISVEVEVSANMGSGYEIRGEVVGESGVISLSDLSETVGSGYSTGREPIADDWRTRFVDAYDAELIEWVRSVACSVEPTGPTSWDGYAATAVADSAIASLYSGQTEEVMLMPKPAFYCTDLTSEELAPRNGLDAC